MWEANTRTRATTKEVLDRSATASVTIVEDFADAEGTPTQDRDATQTEASEAAVIPATPQDE